jgi:hypothetical protein
LDENILSSQDENLCGVVRLFLMSRKEKEQEETKGFFKNNSL